MDPHSFDIVFHERTPVPVSPIEGCLITEDKDKVVLLEFVLRQVICFDYLADFAGFRHAKRLNFKSVETKVQFVGQLFHNFDNVVGRFDEFSHVLNYFGLFLSAWIIFHESN